jgi:hypothetical protein
MSNDCGELAGEQGDVLLGDPAAAAQALLADLGDQNALAAQGGVDDRKAAGAHLAPDELACLVFSFPEEGDFLGSCCGRRRHSRSLECSNPAPSIAPREAFVKREMSRLSF